MSSLDALQRWLDDGGAGCCPDPDAECYVEAGERYDDGAITAHGYDSRFTPVDTLMAAPVQMHLDFGDDLMFGEDN